MVTCLDAGQQDSKILVLSSRHYALVLHVTAILREVISTNSKSWASVGG